MKHVIVSLCSVFILANAHADVSEAELQRYIHIFSATPADHAAQTAAVESFAWLGISDTRLFDVIEQRLLADNAGAKSDRNEKNRVARYFRALAFSGQKKYVPTISKFLLTNTRDATYERYARTALEELPLYEKWNPIISDRTKFDPKLSDDANRVIAMLNADDFLLKRVGAKRVYFLQREDEVLETLATQIRAHYTTRNPDHTDAVSWMLKAMGRTKNAKYKPLLGEAASNATDEKVRRYAYEAFTSY